MADPNAPPLPAAITTPPARWVDVANTLLHYTAVAGLLVGAYYFKLSAETQGALFLSAAAGVGLKMSGKI